MDLSQTKQKLNQQITLTRQKERSLKDLQFELYQAHEGISYWRQGSTSKTNDMWHSNEASWHSSELQRPYACIMTSWLSKTGASAPR